MFEVMDQFTEIPRLFGVGHPGVLFQPDGGGEDGGPRKMRHRHLRPGPDPEPRCGVGSLARCDLVGDGQNMIDPDRPGEVSAFVDLISVERVVAGLHLDERRPGRLPEGDGDQPVRSDLAAVVRVHDLDLDVTPRRYVSAISCVDLSDGHQAVLAALADPQSVPEGMGDCDCRLFGGVQHPC